MKNILIVLLMLPMSLLAQDVAGKWGGGCMWKNIYDDGKPNKYADISIVFEHKGGSVYTGHCREVNIREEGDTIIMTYDIGIFMNGNGGMMPLSKLEILISQDTDLILRLLNKSFTKLVIVNYF